MIGPSADLTWSVTEETVGGDAPPIPASSMEAGWLRDVNLLLWVHTGAAQVEVDGRSRHRVTAGNAVWIPAGAGGRVSTEAGSVAFPYKIPRTTAPAAPADPIHFQVPERWQDWFILQFGHGVAVLPIFGYAPARLVEALGVSGTDPTPGPATRAPGDEPPMPTAPGAHTVARELRNNPTVGHSIEDWAALTACSVSTLRRGFLETGLSFGQWRTLTRLTAGCEFLTAGYGVDRAAAHAGFASRNGFTRAFGDHYGIPPSDYSARTTDPPGAFSNRVAVARGLGALARLLASATDLPLEPADTGPIPATRMNSHTNDVHVLAWTYRGESYLRIGDTDHPRRTGDVIWIPAGVEHQSGNLEDSIALPIGDISTADARITEPLRIHFPPSWNTYLLHRVIANRTALRPDGFDPRSVLDLFREQLAAQRARTVPMPTDARARAVATRFLQRLEAPTDAEHDPAIHETFWRETGMTMPRWQHAARMHIAGDLLDHGAKPGTVARRLGYTHLRSFSRAFARFHGRSPRHYRERGPDQQGGRKSG